MLKGHSPQSRRDAKMNRSNNFNEECLVEFIRMRVATSMLKGHNPQSRCDVKMNLSDTFKDECLVQFRRNCVEIYPTYVDERRLHLNVNVVHESQ